MTSSIINHSLPQDYELKPIPDEKGYFIALDGTVLSFKRGKLRKLKPWVTRAGYLQVSLSGGKKYVHRLLLLTFVGPPPFPDAVCDHVDFNRSNNCLTNIRWYPRVANMKRTVATRHLFP